MPEEKTFFDEAFEETLTFEGGYANITGDTGGETYMGVSRNNFPKWKGWVIIDNIKNNFGGAISKEFKDTLRRSDSLTRLVKHFYKIKFWDKIKLGEITSKIIACEIFDTAVNCYWKTAVKCLQKALNVLNRNEMSRFYEDLVVDGLVGSKSLGAIQILLQNGDDIPLLKALNGEQYIYYKKVVEKKPYKEIFFKSWLRRVGN